ncbi:AraC family transcriptional regulator [Kribbella sp. NPDC058693]|uniref:helix-turn-helix transcriptional regulator n=1 Tax=Kribbella sp. NPDC058693 TaxID=3346602 RepID=UPI00365D01A4
MTERTIVTIAEGPVTRLGQLVLAGEVVDSEPIMSAELRVMDGYVLSVLIDGEGNYRDADGRAERITGGAHTLVPPGFPHTYHTDPGERWTELFVVFTGPLFDALPHLTGAGPRYPVPQPPIEALRTVLRARPKSRRAAEHQLMALADWLVDVEDTPEDDVSMEIVDAMGRLADDLTASTALTTIAAESGLSYDTFRRRFAKQVGQTPAAFRNVRRLQAAATLLRLTDLTHREIARTLGFADEFHLSRRFRSHFGVAPRDYRRT